MALRAMTSKSTAHVRSDVQTLRCYSKFSLLTLATARTSSLYIILASGISMLHGTSADILTIPSKESNGHVDVPVPRYYDAQAWVCALNGWKPWGLSVVD
jgi:hypothetical protein